MGGSSYLEREREEGPTFKPREKVFSLSLSRLQRRFLLFSVRSPSPRPQWWGLKRKAFFSPTLSAAAFKMSLLLLLLLLPPPLLLLPPGLQEEPPWEWKEEEGEEGDSLLIGCARGRMEDVTDKRRTKTDLPNENSEKTWHYQNYSISPSSLKKK